MSGGTERRRLVGRESELARVRAVLDALRAGHGGALRIDGAPGIGKTALLRAAAPEELRCIAIAGVESETALPLAALEELLAPLGADALITAGGGDERDAAGLLRAVAAAMRSAAPLVLVVDDLQWLDPSSRTAVGFLARRAARLGIAVLAAWSLRGARPDEWPGVPVLELRDLPYADALALARATGLSDGVAAALVGAVGGNPLALVQAPAELTPAQRAGRGVLPDPLPAGERLQRVFADRVAALPAPARDALLLAAAGAPATLVADRLGPAEDAGLVGLGPAEIVFAHPLVRSAVYHAASPSQRRAAHRTLAAQLGEPERSWHLALAAPAPDEAIAARLEDLAGRARRRGAPGTAATVLERAARLTPDADAATHRTIAAATAALMAGEPARAEALLAGVLPTLSEPGARADVQLLRGMALHQAGRPREAHALLVAQADAIEATDPARASALLTQACVAMLGPGPLERIDALAARAAALAPAGARTIPAIVHAEILVSLGEHARARELLAAHEPDLLRWDPTAPGHEILALAGLCRLWLGDHAIAEATLTRLVEANRAAGAISSLALPLAVLATLHLRRGDFERAAQTADEAAEIADTGLSAGFIGAIAFAAVAMIAAQRGDDDACHAAAARVLVLASDLDLTSTRAAAEHALGHLHLAHGEAEAAADHLGRAQVLTRRHGARDPASLFNEPDLIEALLHAGRPDEAVPVLAALEEGAARTQGAWAQAAVARCHGLLGPDDALDRHLATALAAHADPDLPFETARTRLVFGERLRRARRRADARVQLVAARDAFAAMGARVWADRAERELRAAGGPAPASDDGWGAGLTARERDVCELVAAGLTNREAAERLFLSTRTVEHHLRIAYRKLGVRSRTQLAARHRAA